MLVDLVRRARRVYIIGNGGSYANAVHMANDLIACGIRAHTLDPATLTASANDHGFETVYARWLKVMGEPGDLLIALSGSGESKNIVNGVSEAKRIGMDTFAIVGEWRRETTVSDMADEAILEGHDMQAAEEHQVREAHDLMRALRT